MKINKKFKPEKAVGKSDDPHAPASKVFIDRERVVTGDGRIAVMIPIELSKDDAARNLVDPYIFREARSYTSKDFDFLEIEFKGDDADGKAVLKNGIELPYQLVKADKELIPVDYDSIVPEGKPKFELALNLALLSKVAHALGTAQVVLSYYGPKEVVKVLPVDPVSKEVGYISQIHGNE